MKRLAFFMFVPALLAACGNVSPVVHTLQPTVQTNPKVLYYGWDTPTPEAVINQAARMDKSAFDAFVFKHSGPEQIFTHHPLPRAAFDEDITALKKIGSKKRSESFLRLQVNTEDGWDWTNESDWAAFEQNLRNYARLARQGGLKGILFDPEPYGFNVWNYETQPARGRKSFTELARIANRRGAAFTRILKTEYPGITVFSLTMLSQSLGLLDSDPSNAEVRTAVQNDTFRGLWYGFANGMVSELDKNIRLVDGNEPSYYYLRAADFKWGRTAVYDLGTAFLEPKNAGIYRTQVRLAHAVYLDGLLNLANSPQFFGYYLSDAERLKMLEHNLFYGLQNSDEYVWIYAEQTRWWDKENIPPGLGARIRRVKERVAKGKTLGFDTKFIEVAKKAFDARVRTGGTVTPNVPDMELELTGLPDTACVAYNNGGKYSCTFPAGSSVTVTPVAEGVTFHPPSYTYTAISEKTKPASPFNQDFSAQ